ncbi:MAG: enoyl-CoA hydratase/isomerase family protein [Sphingomonadaceae bacterium]|nr:enoyl-CoA hydratase/isomerase family protein [Sphingomonadaceae bacterium]
MQVNDVTTYEVDGQIAIIAVDSPPVNAFSAAVRQGIAAAIEQAEQDHAVGAIVLICGGRTFFAGADITELGKAQVEPSLRNMQVMIENAKKPVVAAIHGTALGGGLETALVCHYRIAVPSARLGLPEVNLGLLPGAGGTQRLPRIVGVEKALELVTSGSQVSAKAALAFGLLDALVDEGALRAGAIGYAREVLEQRRPLIKVRDKTDKLDEARANPGIFDAFRKANARKFRGFLAPEACIRCIEAAVNLPFDEGMAFERARFNELLADSQSAAQRHVFFAERQAAKIDDIGADIPVLPIVCRAVTKPATGTPAIC